MLSALEPGTDVDHLTLNLMEMWPALILQILPENTCMKYLPGVTLSAHPGCHLNLASPLHQSDQSNRPEILGNIWSSNNPLTQEFVKERRRQYHALRNSDITLFRDYWWENQRKATYAQSRTRRDKLRQKALNSIKVKMYYNEYHGTQMFLIVFCPFYIPLSTARLAQGEPVYVQCALTEESDPDCYAQKSSPSDDAAHLVIRARGTSIDRTGFDCMLHSNGEKAVYKANTIFDVLVGRTFEESRTLKKRWYTVEKGGENVSVWTDRERRRDV
jgi:hypothetical protein